MNGFTVLRPIVRSFKARYLEEAATHVRGGGHAIVWESPSRCRLVVPKPDDDDVMDLGYWSMLDLGKSRYRVIDKGPLKGFATTPIPDDCFDIVARRAERDSILEGPMHEVELDCLECGACCRDNSVQLFDVDLDRFREGGRADLTKPPYTRKKDGKLILTLLRSKSCRQLGDDNKCAIYPIRPDACSQFPAGSECCLYARESEMGFVDGLPAEGFGAGSPFR